MRCYVTTQALKPNHFQRRPSYLEASTNQASH